MMIAAASKKLEVRNWKQETGSKKKKQQKQEAE